MTLVPMPTALVIGCGGQDGTLLSELLVGRGHAVVGLARQRTTGASSDAPVDLLDLAAVQGLVAQVRPQQVYYLAAYHHSSEDRALRDDATVARRSFEVHVLGLTNLLEALTRECPQARLFYAASSHVFGTALAESFDESRPLSPSCIYGISKAAGVQCCHYYRDSRGFHASAGILFNHESPLRRPDFLSQKIVRAAVDIRKAGRQQTLVVGDLQARVDWGHAPDFVDAFTRILALPDPDDFVIATGQAHSVQQFIEAAFDRVGLPWALHVEERAGIVLKRPAVRVGDSSKLRRLTGWAPTISFEEMVGRLIDAELARAG